MGAREWAALLFLSVLWGGSFLFIEIGLQALPPLTLVLVRLLLSAPMLLVVLAATGRPVPFARALWGPFLVLALLNNVVPFCLFAWGLQHIDGGLGSILNATTPLWAVLVAHFGTRDEPATPLKVAGVVTGFAGVAVMIGGDLLLELGGASLWAQLACLAATLCYALAGVYARRFRGLGVSPMTVSAGQLCAAALVMLPITLLIEQPWSVPAPGIGTMAAMIALALFSTVLAYVLYFQLIASAGATNAILVTFLIPASAILLGGGLLGEQLATRHFLGLAFILLGLALIDGRLFMRRPTSGVAQPSPR